MRKMINDELIRVAIRKAKAGENTALTCEIEGSLPTINMLIFAAEDSHKIKDALVSAGIKWNLMEVMQVDFYEPRNSL